MQYAVIGTFLCGLAIGLTITRLIFIKILNQKNNKINDYQETLKDLSFEILDLKKVNNSNTKKLNEKKQN